MIWQLVPTLEPGAVGTHVLKLAALLDELGIPNRTVAEFIRPSMQGRAVTLDGYTPGAGDVALYHVAIGSGVADIAGDGRARLVLDHHNITPPSFWAGWEPAVAGAAEWALAQLAALAPRAELGIADSHFSEADLAACASTTVLPVFTDVGHQPDVTALDRLHHDGTAWLFVGRLAPNKCQHDLIEAFWAYRSVYDPRAVLRIVGSSSSPRYEATLREMISALRMEDAVTLTGAVSDGELAAHYVAADVFVCLSEHEGFCVPLLEAMHHELPVLAFAATAVPETLGDGGVCLPSKSPTDVAAAVHLVLREPARREALIDAGRRRVRAHDPASRWRPVLEQLAR